MKRFHLLLLISLLFVGFSAVGVAAPVNHHDDVCISSVSNVIQTAAPKIEVSTQAFVGVYSPAEVPDEVCVPLPGADEFIVYGTLGKTSTFPGFVQNNKAPPEDSANMLF